MFICIYADVYFHVWCRDVCALSEVLHGVDALVCCTTTTAAASGSQVKDWPQEEDFKERLGRHNQVGAQQQLSHARSGTPQVQGILNLVSTSLFAIYHLAVHNSYNNSLQYNSIFTVSDT
jgi:hypothetical protein